MSNFNLIRSVPADIICAILFAAGVNENITIYTWKNALPFLWVCRKWRHVAEPILYSMLICGNGYACGIISNYVLFIQRRCLDKVRWFVIRDNNAADKYSADETDYPDNIDTTLHIAKLFDDEDGLKDIELLKSWREGKLEEERYQRELNENYRDDDDGYDFTWYYDQSEPLGAYGGVSISKIRLDASIGIASRLPALLPNVTHLVLKSTHWSFASKVVDILSDSFMLQLTTLECNKSTSHVKLKYGRNIQSIKLNIYYCYRGQLLHLPPQHTENISLWLNGFFSWNLFKYEDRASVAFDKLTRLELGGIDKSRQIVMQKKTSPSQTMEAIPQITFPNLRVLVIRDMLIPYASLKHFLQSPVKILRVEGCIPAVFQIYEHDLGSLDRLVLKFYWDFTHVNDIVAEYADQANMIFSKLQNIPEVHLEIFFRGPALRWSGIYWPHLTHLYLRVEKPISRVFAALSQMPDLLYLEIVARNCHSERFFNDTITFINRLKSNRTRPIQSKVRNITINWTQRKHPGKDFVDALRYLKWYLPELEVLVIITISVTGIQSFNRIFF